MDKLYDYILRKTTEGKIDKEDAIRMIAMLRQGQESRKEDIAIIGIASNLAGTESLEDYWDHIELGLDLNGSFPIERHKGIEGYLKMKLEHLDWEMKYAPGSYLKDIESFDYGFFRITPNEAELMDPSQRLFLQTAWEAIEDAGYGGKKIAGSNTGVYVGYSSSSIYHTMILDTDPASASAALTGNIAAMLPARIAYLLDLKGPNLILDTACSSSSVAIHLACKAIQNGDCQMAIAGGIRINLLPLDNPGLKLGVEAADGRTRTFDAMAEGAGWGEGAASIVLKPLSKAKKDGDHIYAVIKGSAVNQDGASIGITAPNSAAQAEVILKAWKDAEIDPETIAYIEAHGTATKLGDPLEIEGIQKAFQKHTNKKQFCAISTVKSNAGHLYECAGIAGVIKAVLSLKNKKIPASVHFSQPNKSIDFSHSPVYVNTRLREWKESEYPRRCGVSAFGLSGTNCHIVLEEYIPDTNEVEEHSDLPNLLVLSAKSMDSLKGIISGYERFLRREPAVHARDLCYTANTGRGHYSYRVAVIFDGLDDLGNKINFLANNRLEDIDDPNMRYGKHRIVSGNKRELGDNELKEAARAELSRTAAQKLKEFRLDGKTNRQVLQDIADFYIRGAEINWEDLYQGEARKKIHAPAYVFEKNKCWFEIPSLPAHSGRQNLADTLFYTMEWRRDERIPQKSMDQGTVLIFKDCSGTGDSLTKAFRSRQRHVIEVELADGEVCSKIDSTLYRINGSKEGYTRLMLELNETRITRIIHLFALNKTDETATLQELKERQQLGGCSLFYLTKAMVEAGLQDETEVLIVTQYAVEVHGKEKKLVPDHAPVYGLGKVITKEHPNFKCRYIDIDDATPMETVSEELESVYDNYAVAYRDNERYSEVFTELQADRLQARSLTIKDQGVYLITGGLGGIGLEIAKFLASRNKVNLALVNRQAVPPREQWESILNGPESEKLKKRLLALQELQSLGANVACIAADVTDFAAMSEVIADLKMKYGAINGIVHGAGISSDGPLAERSDKMFESIYSPKVYGTWILDHLTRDQDMDFFVMFSSVATLFSAFGQGDYAAANAYMDAYAAYRERKGRPTLTINWTTWKETGMAYDSGHAMDTIFRTLPTSRGIEGFEALLQTTVKRALIGQINFEGAGALLLERSGVACSDGIMKKIAERKEKQRSQKSKNLTNGESIGDGLVILGRQDGAYSETEKKLAACCKTVLGFNEIDIDDNFFEMGADSLVLMRLQGEIESRVFETVAMSELFEYTTVSQLADYLEHRRKSQKTSDSSKYPELQAAPTKAYYPASYAQKRMFLAYKRQPLSTSANQYRVSVLDMRVEPERMERAIGRMIERHEVLRTAVINLDGEVVQQIRDHAIFKLDYWEADEETAAEIISGFKQPFDLTAPPLLRVGLIKIREDKFYLLYDAHHIITDGVSMELFMRELVQLYKGEAISVPQFQYKDYVEWQQACMQMDFMKNQELYWKHVFQDEIPILQLPTDYPREDLANFEGSIVTQYADKELTDQLKKQAVISGSTMFILLLAAYSVLLSKYAAQEDIVIGSPVEARPKREMDKILGMFINMIAIRVKPVKEASFRQYLEQVTKVAVKALDHQDYPMDELINHLDVKRSRERHPLFDTVFIFQNNTELDPSNRNIQGQSFGDVYNLTDYDLTLEAQEKDGMLQLRLEYSTNLFRKETVERMLEDYCSVLQAVSGHPDIQIQDVALSGHHPGYSDDDDFANVSFQF